MTSTSSSKRVYFICSLPLESAFVGVSVGSPSTLRITLRSDSDRWWHTQGLPAPQQRAPTYVKDDVPIKTIRPSLTTVCIGRRVQADKRFVLVAAPCSSRCLICLAGGGLGRGRAATEWVAPPIASSDCPRPRCRRFHAGWRAGHIGRRVPWSRNPDRRRAMASITKIMTAVVAMENSQPDDVVRVPRDSARVGESTSFLRAGEKLPMSELLEALLVKSGMTRRWRSPSMSRAARRRSSS